MSTILSFSNWSRDNQLNENIQAAKAFLLKKAADHRGLGVSDISVEDQQKILNNPDYKAILELLKSNHGYVFPFVKFRFEHGADLSQLRELYQKIKDNAGSLSSLSMTIEEYSNQSTVNGVPSIEALIDEFYKIESRRKHKWVIDKVNGDLRRSIKALPLDQIDRLYRAAALIDKADADAGDFTDPETGRVTNNRLALLSKTNAFSDGAKYITWVEEYTQGVANSDVTAKIAELRKLEPEAGLIYNKDGYVVLGIRTESAQKALCSVGIWCINRGAWSSYGGKPKAIQINIFNFNKPITDVMHISGTTITDDRVTASHDKNDDSIIRSTNPRDHFLGLGYSQELVDAIVLNIPREYAIKKLVTDFNIDTSNPEKLLTDLIKASYQLDNTSDNSITRIIDLVKNNILNNLSEDQIIEIYKSIGILSQVSAMFLNNAIPNLSLDTKNKLIEINDKKVSQLKAIFSRVGADFNKALTSVISNEENIKNILMSGDTISNDSN
jgi:hypothetical protein